MIPDTQSGGSPSLCGGLSGTLDRLASEMDAIKAQGDRIEMDLVAEQTTFALLLLQLKDSFHRLLRRR